MKALIQAVPQLWKEEIVFLKNAVAKTPVDTNIVEIGTAQGGGFHLIASSRRNSDRTPLHSFDPCPGDALSELTKFHRNAFSHSLLSTEGAKLWNSTKQGRVNLLIIDGSHTLQSVHEDYTSWKQHLARPSEIIFHDYDSPLRDGASHPGVKVLCDALMAHKGQGISMKNRKGRYLQLSIISPPTISLSNLKSSFTRWIANAIKIAQIYATSELTSKNGLLQQYKRHSRVCTQPAARAKQARNDSDLAFVLHAASSVGAVHELLLQRTDDRTGVMKWLEYLEMFLHARDWPPDSLLRSRVNPIVRQCNECENIHALSQLCADIAVVVGLAERLFDFIKK